MVISTARAPVFFQGTTLIDNGPDALTRVSMDGNDGQSVPVGVCQPALRIIHAFSGSNSA
jgi:predicted Zn-dependent protease